MPETDTAPQEPAGAAQEQQPTESETDWKAEARKWEQRAKENKKALDEASPKAAQFDALEQASKSELQRIQEQAEQYRTQLETVQREALVNAVALDKGLSPALARRLQGSTREELEADAADLLAQFPQQSNEPRAPRVDRSQGSSATGAATNDPAQQFASIIRGQLGS